MTKQQATELSEVAKAQGFQAGPSRVRGDVYAVMFFGWGTAQSESAFYKTINGPYAATHRQ